MGVWEEPDIPSAVEDINDIFALLQLRNQPNPFNPQTSIKYNLAGPMRVRLSVFDIAGRLVEVLVDDESLATGPHATIWYGQDSQGRNMPSGTYFYHLDAGDFSETKSRVLIR